MKLNKLLIISLFALAACGGDNETPVEEIIASGDMEQIRSQKDQLTKKLITLQRQISKLDSVISLGGDNKNLPIVTAFVAQEEEFKHFIELQGGVTTKQNVLIYPEVPGVLVKIYIKEGDQVKKGQLLGTIDDGGLSSQLMSQKTQLALAKTTYERQKRLWDQQVGSEMQYLQAKANYEATAEAVDQLKGQLSKYQIRAPFSGVIDEIIKDQGTVVSPGPGSEVFRIVNLSDMYIEVSVPETHITSVTVGKEVNVYFPVLGDTIQSKVRQASNYINPNNRAFRVDIPVPNKNGLVKPNLMAKVYINDYTSENAILIPQSIISENAEGEQYIYVVTKGQKGAEVVTKRVIETGKTQGDYVEVLAGIKPGERLIDEGARKVKDQQEVKIIKG